MAFIKWNVENKFRLFPNPAVTQIFQEAYDAVEAARRSGNVEQQGIAHPILTAERRLQRDFCETYGADLCSNRAEGLVKENPSKSFETALKEVKEKVRREGWASLLYGLTCWKEQAPWYDDNATPPKDRDTRNYRRGSVWPRLADDFGGACESYRTGSYLHPRSHRVVARLRSRSSLAGRCRWELFGADGARLLSDAGFSEPVPCAEEPVLLDVPFPAGALVKVWLLSADGGEQLLAQQRIQVKDRLILAFGDSFASGEGNPDEPVKFDPGIFVSYGDIWDRNDPAKQGWNNYPGRVGDWSNGATRTETNAIDFVELINQDLGLAEPGGFKVNRAKWWDPWCHRSLYSHQLRAALQIALMGPDSQTVTFASFSCSGATISKGLIGKKAATECTLPGEYYQGEEDPGGDSHRGIKVDAQLQDAREELRYGACRYHGKDREACLDYATAKWPAKQSGTQWPTRPIDSIFLSVGGNDIGFAALVASAYVQRLKPGAREDAGDGQDNRTDTWKFLLNVGNLPCDIRRKEPGRRLPCWPALSTPILYSGKDTDYLLEKELPRRYQKLADQLEEKILARQACPDNSPRCDLERRINQTRVFLTAYPQLGFDENGQACDGEEGVDVHPDFRLDGVRIGKIERDIIGRLDRQMRKAADDRGWVYVDSYRNADCDALNGECFVRHGLCAVGDPVAEQVAVPRKYGQKWEPYSPADFRPYAERTRWFRTPNDSFMVANYHAHAMAVLGCRRWATEKAIRFLGDQDNRTETQLFLSSYKGGAFHPTAEGHAVIADGLVQRWSNETSGD